MSDILIHTESGVQTLTINRIAKKNTVQRPTVPMPEAKKRIGVIQRLQAIEEALGL
mgnify:CR=1 FL=1